MKEEPHYPEIAPELEARIVALVLGEASDFERDELNRLIQQRPELEAFKAQIESVHGLLRDAASDEPVAEDDEWKLSADKRGAVLAVVNGDAVEPPTVRFASKPVENRSSVKESRFWKLTKIAAVLGGVGFFGSIAISAMLLSQSARSRRVASSELSTLETLADSLSFQMGDYDSPGDAFTMNAATSVESAKGRSSAAAVEFEGDKDSKSALSDIRHTLDFYSIASPEEVSGPEPAQQPADNLAAIPQVVERSDLDPSTHALGLPGSPNWGIQFRDRDEWSKAGGESQHTDRSRFALPDRGSEADGYGEPANRPDPAADSFGSQESGRGQSPSQLQSQLFGGTNMTFTDEIEDSRAAGKQMKAKGVAVNDEQLGERRFGVDGARPDEGFSRDLSAGQKSESNASQQPAGAIRFGEWDDMARSQPLVAGLNGLEKSDEAKEASGGAAVDAIDLDAEVPAYSNFSPHFRSTTGEALGNKEEFAPPQRYENDFGRESGAMPSADDVAFHSGREFDLKESLDRPMSGPAMKQLEEESDSDGAVDELKLTEEYRGDVAKYWESLSAETSGKEVELLRRRARLAVEIPALEDSEAIGPATASPATRYDKGSWYGYAPPMLEDRSESIRKTPAKKAAATEGLNEKIVTNEPVSTFSLHVSDVSFKLAQTALAQGEWPEAAKVRIEEFVNAFDYGDPMPSRDDKVACVVEQCVHPFLQQRNVLRVSMRTAAAGRSSNTPLRLTLLLDNSGSMERSDRQQTVRRAFALLAEQLKPFDQVTLISFARQPRLLADKVGGADSRQLVQLVNDLPSEGGTNIEAALKLAFEKAREQQVENAQNRIILLTDGAVNLGNADPDSLSRMVTTMRDAGIAFDAAGISAEGLNDEILEALTRRGDGRYYLLDSLEAADDGFSRQIAGALRPSAKNVKVQIEFNRKRVGRYKLLGFEQHLLKQEDFRDDTVDAAEMAAAEAGVAVYQFEAKPDGEGDVGMVSVRFRDLSTGRMIENRWPIPYEADAPRAEQAAPSLRIATSAALFAAKLRGEPLGESVDLQTLSRLMSGLPDQNAPRVGQLQLMIQQARQVSGN